MLEEALAAPDRSVRLRKGIINMIESFIKFVLSNFTLALLVIGLIFLLISLYFKKKPLTRSIIIEALISYFFLFSVGIGYIYNFIMHVVFAEYTASFIGWANSPFQLEVGFVSLGIGVAGLIAFKKNTDFRIATFIPPAIFLWGAAGGHIYQIIKTHNYSPGNAGVILWTDILLPLIGFILLYVQYKNKKSDKL